MNWIGVERSFEERLQEILLSWEGTPYMSGAQLKGIGVDCVRFVAGVLDELKGTKTDIISLPLDTCMQDPERAVNGMVMLLRSFDLTTSEDFSYVHPGDIVITGTRGAPGHAMIAGSVPNQLWHADGKRVSRTIPRFGGNSLSKLFRIVRPSR